MRLACGDIGGPLMLPTETASYFVTTMFVVPVLVTCGAAMLVALFKQGAR